MTALRFDFRAATYPAIERVVEVPVTRSGVCLGVIQWLRIELDDQATYENPPASSHDNPGNWLHSHYPFRSPVRVEAGRTLRLVAGHGRQSLYFRVADPAG